MSLIRWTLVAIATMAGSGAAASWILAQPTRAGILAAICAASVIIAEGIAYCQRRSWARARQAREQVWARRERQRRHDELIRGIDEGVLTPEAYRALWPFDVGSPE